MRQKFDPNAAFTLYTYFKQNIKFGMAFTVEFYTETIPTTVLNYFSVAFSVIIVLMMIEIVMILIFSIKC